MKSPSNSAPQNDRNAHLSTDVIPKIYFSLGAIGKRQDAQNLRPLVVSNFPKQTTISSAAPAPTVASDLQYELPEMLSARPTRFYCTLCPSERSFLTKQTLKKHINYCHQEKTICERCHIALRGDNLARHLKKYCSNGTVLDDFHLFWSNLFI